jgi:hypothetical protein
MVLVRQITWRHVPEYSNLYSHRWENLKISPAVGLTPLLHDDKI